MKKQVGSKKVGLDKIYALSEEIVTRQVHGEFVIIPITSGVGDLEDDIFTLDESGRAIWDKLDGKKSLAEIANELRADFDAEPGKIEQDLVGLIGELVKRRIVVEAS